MIICIDIVGIDKPKQGTLIRDTLEQALLTLLPRRRNPIFIDIEIALPEDISPAKALVHEDDTDVFFISLSQELLTLDMKDELIETICHEAIHIKQYIRKELKESKWSNVQIWKGKPVFTDSLDYYDLPWEIEAYNMEEDIVKRINIS